MSRFAIPVSELPALTPSRVRVRPVWRAILQRLSLLLPGALLVTTVACGGLAGVPPWAWLSVVLMGTGLMLELYQ